MTVLSILFSSESLIGLTKLLYLARDENQSFYFEASNSSFCGPLSFLTYGKNCLVPSLLWGKVSVNPLAKIQWNISSYDLFPSFKHKGFSL